MRQIQPAANDQRLLQGEIDALTDAALRLLTSIEHGTPPSEALQIQRRAMLLIEAADRMERDGAAIMTDRPTLRSAFGSLARPFPND